MRYKTEELERHGNTEIFDAILYKQTVRDTDGRGNLIRSCFYSERFRLLSS